MVCLEYPGWHRVYDEDDFIVGNIYFFVCPRRRLSGFFYLEELSHIPFGSTQILIRDSLEEFAMFHRLDFDEDIFAVFEKDE